MSSATVTPSLVTLGLPQPLSSTALRPRGPSVERTARASLLTPASSFCRASSLYVSCFAAIHKSPFNVNPLLATIHEEPGLHDCCIANVKLRESPAVGHKPVSKQCAGRLGVAASLYFAGPYSKRGN